MTDFLTVLDPLFEARRAQTARGMAYWSGTGPKGEYCGGCAYFVTINVGRGQTTRCAKYAAMMGGKHGTNKLPQTTPACKYFEAIQGKQNAAP